MINPRTQNTIRTMMRQGCKVDQQDYQLVQTNVIGWVARYKQSFLSKNIKNDKRFNTNLFNDEKPQSVMCVHLQHEGKSIGYIVASKNNERRNFNFNDLLLFEKFAALSLPFICNVQKIEEIFKAPIPDATLLSKYEKLGMLGKSQRFIELLKAIEAAARCDVRVHLEGQSGTGKERIARAIHYFSSRKQNPFIAIDCATIPENLLESELFGHVKGAFTGANYDRTGLFEEADEGTLFMDEIANLPYIMQAKLLRVVQEGEIRILGSNEVRKVNVRIISASSSSLRDMVELKQFREDLYYRLFVYPIYVPTLNDRFDDIPLLAQHFLHKFAQNQGKSTLSFHPSILKFMQNRHWRGNIRELENFIERLVTLCPADSSAIDKSVLPPEFKQEFKTLQKSGNVLSLQKSLRDDLAAFEAQLIRQTLIDNNWNQAKTARTLKIAERTMRYKMEKLNISKPDARQ